MKDLFLSLLALPAAKAAAAADIALPATGLVDIDGWILRPDDL